MCHGDTRMIPVEVHEATYPFMIEGCELRADSGGAGEFRGGLGLTRRYLMLTRRAACRRGSSAPNARPGACTAATTPSPAT